MKKRFLLFLSFILLAFLVLPFLTGCGSQKTSMVEEDALEIKLWARSFEDYADNLLQKQVNEFNSDLTDGIQVTLHFYGDDNTYDTAIAAGQENGTVAEAFEHGLSEPCKTCIKKILDEMNYDPDKKEEDK